MSGDTAKAYPQLISNPDLLWPATYVNSNASDRSCTDSDLFCPTTPKYPHWGYQLHTLRNRNTFGSQRSMEVPLSHISHTVAQKLKNYKQNSRNISIIPSKREEK
jgi:hypothetical protein